MSIALRFYYFSIWTENGHFPSFFAACSVVGGNERSRYGRYLADALTTALRTPEKCDTFLCNIDAVEQGRIPKSGFGLNDLVLDITPEYVQVSIMICEDWTDQPEGRFTFEECKWAVTGWKKFLQMPESLDARVDVHMGGKCDASGKRHSQFYRIANVCFPGPEKPGPVILQFYNIDHGSRDYKFESLSGHCFVAGEGDLPRYRQYLAIALRMMPQTPEWCDKVLHDIDAVEQSGMPKTEKGDSKTNEGRDNDCVLTLTPEYVQVGYKDLLDQPEGRFTLGEWRRAVIGWKEFLCMPKSLDTRLDVWL